MRDAHEALNENEARMPILRIPADTAASDRYEVDAARLIAGDPRQGVANLYSDPGRQFHCGIWEAAPATWRVRYSEHEFCHLLEGRILIRDEEGDAMEVRAGDSFVVPAGFSGTWQVLERARKLYAIFEPAASPDGG
ncbi:cupin domain-containing protein [Arenimonas sp.]|uniref:cupin domain-containing protein n=1 Tax=Arenimonas sp. TaxID=1872635 RepID=UPI0039E25AC2